MVGFLRGAMERFKELEDGREKLLENKAMFPGSTAQDGSLRTPHTSQIPMLGLMHSSKGISHSAETDVDMSDEFSSTPVYAMPQRTDSFRDMPTGGLSIRSS